MQATTPWEMLPSRQRTGSAPRNWTRFAAQYSARGLPCERFTAALASRTSCITRGRGGWLDLPRGGLAPPILCQLPGALGDGSETPDQGCPRRVCSTSDFGRNGCEAANRRGGSLVADRVMKPAERTSGSWVESSHCTGFMVGNAITSRIEGLSVISIASRSMPMPSPPIGGMPNASA